MSTKRKSVGTGITKRTETHVDLSDGVGPEEKESLKKLLDAAATNPLTESRIFCEQLAGESWAKKQEALLRVRTATTRREKDEALASLAEAQRPTVDSKQWFAEKVLEHLGLADSCREQGHLNNAARYNFQAGLLFGVAGMKFGWERHAIVGARNYVATHKGGEIVHNQALVRYEKYREIIDDARAQNPKASKASVLGIASKKAKVSISTLKRAEKYRVKPLP